MTVHVAMSAETYLCQTYDSLIFCSFRSKSSLLTKVCFCFCFFFFFLEMIPTKQHYFLCWIPVTFVVQVGLSQGSESEKGHNESPQACLVANVPLRVNSTIQDKQSELWEWRLDLASQQVVALQT